MRTREPQPLSSSEPAVAATEPAPDAAELARLRHEVAALRTRAARDAAARRELVAALGHELRTPLTVLQGFVKLLASGSAGSLTESQAQFVEECRRSAARLDRVVEMLLRDARDGRDAPRCEIEEASLTGLLRDALRSLSPLVERAGMSLELDLAPDADRARFDAARIEQVVVNLVRNALEHAASGGALRVATRRIASPGEGAPAAVEVRVGDAGPGVPPAERERIFEPHVRGSTARGGDGLGLGLALCRRIVEAHGGRIEVRDEPGGGACFAFTLPAALPKEP